MLKTAVFIGFKFQNQIETIPYFFSKLKNNYELRAVENELITFLEKCPKDMYDNIMKLGEISFIPDVMIAPKLHPQDHTKFNLKIYGREFDILSNFSVSDYSEANPLIISIEKRRKQKNFMINFINFLF